MPLNVELIANALFAAAECGAGLLVVDASFDLLRKACSRLYVMDRGLIIGAYQPSEFTTPDALAATYLGVGV